MEPSSQAACAPTDSFTTAHKAAFCFTAPCTSLILTAMPADSIYRAAFVAANAFRDDVASRLGASAAAEAAREWNQQRFWIWLADRVLEHAVGEKQWLEFGARNFSRVGARRGELQQCVEELVTTRRQLAGDTLIPFAEKEKLTQRLAELANSLLE